MEFVIFAEHFDFLGELILLVDTLHVLLVVVVVVVILELDIDGRECLLEYFIEFFGEVEILRRRVLAVEGVGHKRHEIRYFLLAHVALLPAAALHHQLF